MAQRPPEQVGALPLCVRIGVEHHGDISWIIGGLLPEAYSGRGNSNCQDAAEQVIDTFKVLPQ